jgi:hypothetical protein
MPSNCCEGTNSLRDKTFDCRIRRTNRESDTPGNIKQESRILVRLLVRKLLNGDGDTKFPLKNPKRFLKGSMHLACNVVAGNSTPTACEACFNLGVQDSLPELAECFKVDPNLCQNPSTCEGGPLLHFCNNGVLRHCVRILHERVELLAKQRVAFRRTFNTGSHSVAHAQSKWIAHEPSSLGDLLFRDKHIGQQ